MVSVIVSIFDLDDTNAALVPLSFSASNWIADAYGDNGYRYLYAVADAIHARGKSLAYERVSPIIDDMVWTYLS